MDLPNIETNALRSESNGCFSAQRLTNNVQSQRKLTQGCSLEKMHDVTNVKKTVKRWFAKNIGNNASKKLNRRIGDDQQVNIGDNLMGQFEVMMFVIPNKYKSKLGHIQTLINKQSDRITISNGISVLLPKGQTAQEIKQFSLGLQDKDQILKETQNKQIRCFDKVKNRTMNSIQGKVEDEKSKKQEREDNHQNFLTPKKESQYNDIQNGSSVVDESISTQSKQLFDNKTFQEPQGSHDNKKQVIGNKFEGQNRQAQINEGEQKKETKSQVPNENKMETSQNQAKKIQKNEQPKENAQHTAKIEQSATIKKESKIQEKVDMKLKIQQAQNIRNKDWFKQLQKLSVAQTQLTYMSQHFEWLLKFYQNNAHSSFGIDMFQCKTEVKIFKNKAFQNFSGFCPASKSKKDSRHQSSIKCLASLYLCVEGLWETYSEIKKDTPSLCQQQKSDNNQILEDWLLEIEGLQKKAMKLEDEQKSSYSIDAHTYVQSLTNCKKELYYMIAQNNKIFMNPKWKLSNENLHGWWFSQCVVRYEVSQKVFEYRIKCRGQNRRESEQLVSKGLLKKIYTDFPTLFKKFKKIKHERGLF